VKPGNRVLIRSANNPAMVACWLAATKAGAVVVNTMPMLRAGELARSSTRRRFRSRCATQG
jgi:2-aminobenzoate-CoA ligase